MVDIIQSVTSGVEQTPTRSTARPVSSGKTSAKPAGSTAGASPAKRSTGDVSGLVGDINGLVYELSATKVTFDVDAETGRHVVRVLNKETGEIIRQLPPEELLTLVARMRQLTGLIFNEEA